MVLKKTPVRHGSDSCCSASHVSWGQYFRETLEKVVGKSLGLGGVLIPVLPLSNPVNWDNLFIISSLLLLSLKVHLNHRLDVNIKQMNV